MFKIHVAMTLERRSSESSIHNDYVSKTATNGMYNMNIHRMAGHNKVQSRG